MCVCEGVSVCVVCVYGVQPYHPSRITSPLNRTGQLVLFESPDNPRK